MAKLLPRSINRDLSYLDQLCSFPFHVYLAYLSIVLECLVCSVLIKPFLLSSHVLLPGIGCEGINGVSAMMWSNYLQIRGDDGPIL